MNPFTGLASGEDAHYTPVIVAGEERYRVKGVCRIMTDTTGALRHIIGTGAGTSLLEVKTANGETVYRGAIASNQEIEP